MNHAWYKVFCLFTCLIDRGQFSYKNTNEIMSFSTLSLPVSPQIKITDFGMMDVHNHEIIPIVERYL